MSAPNKTPTRNNALDGVRGYAALAVGIYHSILCLHNSNAVEQFLKTPLHDNPNLYHFVTKLLLVIFNGETAVILFFILSGAVLFASLQSAIQKKSLLKCTTDFIIARLFRIYPALIICLICFFVAFLLLNKLNPVFFSFSIEQLFHNLILYKPEAMHGATWTLQIEIVAVPFILVSFYLYHRLGIWGGIISFIYMALAIKLKFLVFYHPTLAGCLYYFVLGFAMTTPQAKYVFSKINGKIAPVALIALLMTGHIGYGLTPLSFLVKGFFAFIFVGIIFYKRSVLFDRFLTHRIAEYFGKISYSVYLFNLIFIDIALCMLTKLPSVTERYLEAGMVIALFSLIVTLPVAHCVEKYIEQPCIRLGRWVQNIKLPISVLSPQPSAESARALIQEIYPFPQQ